MAYYKAQQLCFCGNHFNGILQSSSYCATVEAIIMAITAEQRS